MSPTNRHLGHDVTLVRYLRTVEQVVAALEAGLRTVARLEREPVDAYERDHQAVVVGRR